MESVTEAKEIAFTSHKVNNNPLNESKQANYDWFSLTDRRTKECEILCTNRLAQLCKTN